MKYLMYTAIIFAGLTAVTAITTFIDNPKNDKTICQWFDKPSSNSETWTHACLNHQTGDLEFFDIKEDVVPCAAYQVE